MLRFFVQKACSGSSLGKIWEIPIGQQYFNVSHPKKTKWYWRTWRPINLIHWFKMCVSGNTTWLSWGPLFTHLPNYITALQLASHRPNHEILLETRISETVFVMTWMHTPVSGPNPYMTYVIYVCIYIYIIISPNRRKSESLLIWWFTFLVVGFNHLEKNEIVNGFRMTSHIWNGK